MKTFSTADISKSLRSQLPLFCLLDILMLIITFGDAASLCDKLYLFFNNVVRMEEPYQKHHRLYFHSLNHQTLNCLLKKFNISGLSRTLNIFLPHFSCSVCLYFCVAFRNNILQWDLKKNSTSSFLSVLIRSSILCRDCNSFCHTWFIFMSFYAVAIKHILRLSERG